MCTRGWTKLCLVSLSLCWRLSCTGTLGRSRTERWGISHTQLPLLGPSSGACGRCTYFTGVCYAPAFGFTASVAGLRRVLAPVATKAALAGAARLTRVVRPALPRSGSARSAAPPLAPVLRLIGPSDPSCSPPLDRSRRALACQGQRVPRCCARHCWLAQGQRVPRCCARHCRPRYCHGCSRLRRARRCPSRYWRGRRRCSRRFRDRRCSPRYRRGLCR